MNRGPLISPLVASRWFALVLVWVCTDAHAEDASPVEGVPIEDIPPVAERHWSEALVPSRVSITAGALFPMFLIYETPGPLIGVEVGWDLSTRTTLLANVGLGVVWETGTERYLVPIGLSLRVLPWEVGPWLQFGVGATPYVEHVGVVLPEREVSVTDTGATMTLNVKLGVNLWGWDVGFGYEHNLLPTPFYETYDGDEALPWTGTVMAWIGVPIWRSER